MGENAFHMVFQERWVFSHSSPNPALAATRLWAGYGELVGENSISPGKPCEMHIMFAITGGREHFLYRVMFAITGVREHFLYRVMFAITGGREHFLYRVMFAITGGREHFIYRVMFAITGGREHFI